MATAKTCKSVPPVPSPNEQGLAAAREKVWQALPEIIAALVKEAKGDKDAKPNYCAAKFLFDFALVGASTSNEDDKHQESLAALLLRHIGPFAETDAHAGRSSATSAT